VIERIALGADPAAWRDAGFRVEGDSATVGSVQLQFGPGEGITGWRLSAGGEEPIDGLPVAPAAETEPTGGAHPNGVTQIDHIVVFTPDLERTTQAFEQVGVERRRVRKMDIGTGSARQGFFRLGEVILEVVEHPRVEPGAARFWGITFAVADLDACAELLGDRLGSIGDAVQPGRRIATMRGGADLGLPVALISASD
jgi:glyoxalase/bleomycin resistance protein/dioxygenase superfamily protein